MNHGGNPYGVLPPVPGLSYADVFSVNNTATIAYLPFWPILTGLIFALYSATGLQNRFLCYFMLKQPAIFGDVALAYLLYRYVSVRKSSLAGRWALSFWLFVPFTVIISGIWGMFDSIAISFVAISLMSQRKLGRSLWAGLAVFAKSIPIIYAAPITLNKPARGKDVVALILAGALPVALSACTILVMRWPISTVGATIGSTVGKEGGSMSIWDAFFYFNYLGLPAPPSEIASALGYAWIPAIIVLTLVALSRFRLETDHGLVQALLVGGCRHRIVASGEKTNASRGRDCCHGLPNCEQLFSTAVPFPGLSRLH